MLDIAELQHRMTLITSRHRRIARILSIKCRRHENQGAKGVQWGWGMGRGYPLLSWLEGLGSTSWAHPAGSGAEPWPPMHFWHIWGPENTSGRENSVTLLNDVQSPERYMFIWNENDALKLQTLVFYVPTKPVLSVKKPLNRWLGAWPPGHPSGYAPVQTNMYSNVVYWRTERGQ